MCESLSPWRKSSPEPAWRVHSNSMDILCCLILKPSAWLVFLGTHHDCPALIVVLVFLVHYHQHCLSTTSKIFLLWRLGTFGWFQIRTLRPLWCAFQLPGSSDVVPRLRFCFSGVFGICFPTSASVSSSPPITFVFHSHSLSSGGCLSLQICCSAP